MATRYAVASGSWSNPAIWDGGTLPTSSDDVFSNNRTVIIDQDITAITLRNISNVSPAITQGGSFVVSGGSGTRNITLTGTASLLVPGVNSGFAAAVSPLLNITATGSAITNINSNLVGGVANVNNGVAVVINGNSTVNIIGRVGTPPAFGTALTSQASGATINIVGDMYGGGSANGLNITQPSTVTVVGNLTGNTTTATGTAITVGAVSTVTVTGNLIGGAGVSAQAILVGGGGGSTVNITGNLTGGAGEAIGDNNQIQAFNITGNVTASSTRPGIVCANTTLVTLNGNMVNTSNVIAIYSSRLRISPSTSQTWTCQTSGPNRLLYTSNALSDFPAITNVRSGVTYAAGTLTGSCAIPSTSSVVFGVPVDNSTGSAIISRAQLYSDVGAIIAGYNT
jgi:hypothetical protein